MRKHNVVVSYFYFIFFIKKVKFLKIKINANISCMTLFVFSLQFIYYLFFPFSLYIILCKYIIQRSTPVFFANKTDRHDITEILLKVTLNTINQQTYKDIQYHTSSVFLFCSILVINTKYVPYHCFVICHFNNIRFVQI